MASFDGRSLKVTTELEHNHLQMDDMMLTNDHGSHTDIKQKKTSSVHNSLIK